MNIAWTRSTFWILLMWCKKLKSLSARSSWITSHRRSRSPPVQSYETSEKVSNTGILARPYCEDCFSGDRSDRLFQRLTILIHRITGPHPSWSQFSIKLFDDWYKRKIPNGTETTYTTLIEWCSWKTKAQSTSEALELSRAQEIDAVSRRNLEPHGSYIGEIVKHFE